MSHAQDLVAVLDANVLYLQWLRDVVLTLALMSYFDPVWSDRIIAEMRRNVLAHHPDIDPQRFDDTTIAALRATFPDAWVDVSDELVAEMDRVRTRLELERFIDWPPSSTSPSLRSRSGERISCSVRRAGSSRLLRGDPVATGRSRRGASR